MFPHSFASFASLASLFVRALGVGFAIAAPLGPIGLLVVRRTLASGVGLGFATGLGAAVADAMFALAAGLGFATLAATSPAIVLALRIAGGAFLVVMGARGLTARPSAESARGGDLPVAAADHARAFIATFLLTLASPLTIVSFAAVAASLGVTDAGVGVGAAGTSAGRASILAGGVFLGSAAWWAVLSGGVRVGARAARKRVPTVGIWVGRASSAAIFALGVWTLLGCGALFAR